MGQIDQLIKDRKNILKDLVRAVQQLQTEEERRLMKSKFGVSYVCVAFDGSLEIWTTFWAPYLSIVSIITYGDGEMERMFSKKKF